MALTLCLASSHALSVRSVSSRRGALYGAAAALSLPASVRAAADVDAQLSAGVSALDVMLRDWDLLTIDCTYAEVPRALLETKNKQLLLEKASTLALFDKSTSITVCKTSSRCAPALMTTWCCAIAWLIDSTWMVSLQAGAVYTRAAGQARPSAADGHLC